MMLMEKNQPLLSWKVSLPLPYAQKSQSAPVINFNSCASPCWKSILIIEASLKIRYYDFNERSYSTKKMVPIKGRPKVKLLYVHALCHFDVRHESFS